MIYKSYLIEQNLNNLKSTLTLFYGENIGLKKDFKDLIKFSNKECEIINFTQEQILKNENIIFNEINNISLFEKEKIIFIENSDDKILETIEQINENLKNTKIFIFADVLEKKSKLRSYFEKSKHFGVVPCYQDNEISLKKIINQKLRGFDGLTPFNTNLIFDNCDMDRSKLLNELDKIKTLFAEKKIDTEKLQKVLNSKSSDNFNNLKDVALVGNKVKTNKLLSQTVIESEKTMFYLNMINQRLDKLIEINQNEIKDTASVIDKIKPPIFWKDKPMVLEQAKKWSLEKTKKLREETYNYEVYIKSNSVVNRDILIKKLMIDICELANS